MRGGPRQGRLPKSRKIDRKGFRAADHRDGLPLNILYRIHRRHSIGQQNFPCTEVV